MAQLTRRDLLRIAAAGPVLALRPPPGRGAPLEALRLPSFAKAPGRVVAIPGTARVRLDRRWDGDLCRSRVVNEGRRAVRVQEVVLFDVTHRLPPETGFYGEGFQMLSQTGGTLGAPADLGNYTDAEHYKMPQPEGARAVHGVLTLTPPSADPLMVAFTSCRRFDGLFRVRPATLEVVMDTEGRELGPGEAWDLEELTFRSGTGREALLDALAQRLAENHPPLRFAAPPSGWCSWYCFGPGVTARQVLDNLDVIATAVPGLKYIQIDDGYQPAMGDWLDTGPAFGGDVQGVLAAIRERGFEPAIWVAPFIAEAGSKLFQRHPGWFVQGQDGAPLRSDRVTFGGWRRGPWYALDGTHPEAQAHLETVFRTMREEWGVTYFKLDANFWGAIHGGRFHDRRATRIEAYRRGMQAVLRGSGQAFVLGCNHPIWGSLGLIHGSRSSNDIKRDWKRFTTIARQNLGRNWQNGRLWWNDPDAVVLTGDLGEEEFRFHATSIYASGGMILSGDDLTRISPPRLDMLRKLQPPTGVAARLRRGGVRPRADPERGRALPRRAAGHDHRVAEPPQRGRPPRVPLGSGLLVARPREPRGTVRAARRHEQPGQLRRAPAAHGAAQRPGAGPGRGMEADERCALRGPRREPPARVVRGRGHAHGASPRVRAVDPGARDRARNRHHRHHPPGRGRAGRRGPGGLRRAHGGRARGDPALVRGLPRLHDHAPLRDRGARHHQQPRHVLGDAGGGVRAPDRRPREDGLLPQPLQAGAGGRAHGGRRKLPPRDGAHEAVRLCAVQPRGAGHGGADPLDARGRPVDLRDAGRPRPAKGDGLHVPLHARQEELAPPPGRDVPRPLADAAGQPALRRPGPGRAGLPRAVEDAARRFGRRGDRAELLRAPAGAVGGA